MRMKDETKLRKTRKGDTEGRRPNERPRGRWLDAVDMESKNTMMLRKWKRSTAEDRDNWMRRFEEAKVQVRL